MFHVQSGMARAENADIDPRTLHQCNAWCAGELHTSMIWTPDQSLGHSWFRLEPPFLTNQGRVEVVGIEPAREAGERPATLGPEYIPALITIRFLEPAEPGDDDS